MTTSQAADPGDHPAGTGTTGVPDLQLFMTIALPALTAADDATLDALPFGVVGMDRAGLVTRYSQRESEMAGMSRGSVLGGDFFLTTGICMNNYLVAQRFEDEPALDVALDYVLTFRMRPTPVKLRLLQAPDIGTRFILIRR